MSSTRHRYRDTRGIGGHPRGLTTLFVTELWERFSYYGMRALLVLYMVATPSEGGLGLDVPTATAIYGMYTMWVYLLTLPGGWIADRWLGTKSAVLVGGAIIAAGHTILACMGIATSLAMLYAGLSCVACGTGLLKPSISAMVGELYEERDERRDAGFALFFMGINIGAACAPIVCGFLAQHHAMKHLLALCGFNPAHSWHWGFGAAGLGMMAGLLYFYRAYKHIGRQEEFSSAARRLQYRIYPSLSSVEKRRIAVILVLFLFTVLFGVVSEQAGSSMSLFADRLTDRSVGSWEVPSSWFQAVVPIYVILLAPLFSRLWMRLGERQPSFPAKFALSLLCVAGACACMVVASILAVSGKVSPLWLLTAFFVQEIGAVLLNPTGLSVVTKLSPGHLVGLMMGVWFLASALASRIAGYLAGFFDEKRPDFLAQYFAVLSGAMILASLVLLILTPRLRRMIGDEK
ncbi:MAG: peptide MFS transporter [Bacteroidota bacterium]|nr:peptide MFS transporter [Candidatus Kapabacteria bacterium]MDW8220095.1 peptide MFS transporter [Bacteroidota bacterium]